MFCDCFGTGADGSAGVAGGDSCSGGGGDFVGCFFSESTLTNVFEDCFKVVWLELETFALIGKAFDQFTNIFLLGGCAFFLAEKDGTDFVEALAFAGKFGEVEFGEEFDELAEVFVINVGGFAAGFIEFFEGFVVEITETRFSC